MPASSEQGRVFVAGHRGMVGSAIVRRLRERGQPEVITRSRQELDLTRQADVEAFFAGQSINTVYLAAARVGGIKANNEFPADFITENLQIQTNVIESAHRAGVQRLLFLGSSCIYPRVAEQPMSEDALMTGPLEETNEAYAVAKIAGIKMCEAYRRQFGSDFRSAMPTNLYGPNDNFDLETSHVLPALLRKFHQAVKSGAHSVAVWGSGRPRREFLHVDDMAAASCHLIALSEERYWSAVDDHCSHINVGCGSDVSIAELAEMIASVTGFEGQIEYDPSMPDGTPRKLLDISRLEALGWAPEIPLQRGISETYRWMSDHWNDG
ncbi:MAG: GDP-L-fucose synthase [Xanthomonadales bacterium]|nr:GDP-L-fucose synthase [Xanthomonadales bacterium]